MYLFFILLEFVIAVGDVLSLSLKANKTNAGCGEIFQPRSAGILWLAKTLLEQPINTFESY